tara:strand:- start:1214 stop:3439 length:2226 start_codon:yes stop_codon:yes gene_type:complete
MMKYYTKLTQKLTDSISIDHDPIKLYIQNHGFFLKYFSSIALLIVFAKFYLYGIPKSEYLIFFIFVLLPISVLFAYEQIKLYRKLEKMSSSPYMRNRTKTFFLIVLNKIGYTVPWMVFLFWPLEVNFFFFHILGYAFIFCIIAIYPSISAPVWPLFIVDIGLQLMFLALIVILNYDIQETPIAGLFIITFSFYAVISALKMNQTYLELFSKNKDIRSALKQTKQAHEAKAEFLAIMSHEIRTPMNGIMGMIDFLKETKLNEDQSQCVKTIHECSDTLINTLNDVLDYSKIEAGKFSVRKINFNLHELAQHIFNMFRLKMAEKNITFHLDIHDNVPEYIYSDPNRIQQIIANLLNNAHKFTDNGIVQFRLSVSGTTDQNSHEHNIIIEIEDNGIGISEPDKKKLFKRYSQIKDNTLEDPGGTGLGLVIVKQLSLLLGGDITFDSNKNIGSTFIVKLPYLMPIHVDEKSAITNMDKEDSPALKILLVDDNKLNQQIVERYLKNEGHKVFVASSGQQALEFLQQNHELHIILMDLHMPDINGMDATKKIRKNLSQYDNVPIIALTANLTEETLKTWYELGIAAHIPKPIQKEEFFNIILHHAVHAHFLTSPEKNLQNEENKSNDKNNEKLYNLAEAFGPDYACYVVENNLIEIKKLLQNIPTLLHKDKINIVKTHIHDLITVSGNIGMDRTSDISRNIENLFEQNKTAEAISKINLLLATAEEEATYVKTYINSLAKSEIADLV